MTNIPGFITVTEAAESIGCTPVRVRQLIDEGTITGEKIHNRMWLVHEKSVKKFIDTPQDEKRGRPRISQR